MEPHEDPSIEDEEMEEQARPASPHAAGSRGRPPPEEVQSRLRDISKTELEEHFHMSIETAATKLGIGLTTLKKLCRHYGIGRWPYRKVQQIVRLGRMFSAGLSQGRDYVFLVELLMELNLPADSKLWDNVDPKAAQQIRTIIRDVLQRHSAFAPPQQPQALPGAMAPPPAARGIDPAAISRQAGGTSDPQQLQHLVHMLSAGTRPPMPHAVPATPAYRSEQRSMDALLAQRAHYGAAGPPPSLERGAYQPRQSSLPPELDALRAMLDAQQGDPWGGAGAPPPHYPPVPAPDAQGMMAAHRGWRRGSVGTEGSQEMHQQPSQQSSQQQWMGMLHQTGRAYSADPHLSAARDAARHAPPTDPAMSGGSSSSTTIEQALVMLQQALQQGSGSSGGQGPLRGGFEQQQQQQQQQQPPPYLSAREEHALRSLGTVFATPPPSMPQRPSSPRYGGSLPANFFRPPPPRGHVGPPRETSSDLFDLLQGMLRTQEARGGAPPGGHAPPQQQQQQQHHPSHPAMMLPLPARSSASYPPPTTYRTMRMTPQPAPPLFSAPHPVVPVTQAVGPPPGAPTQPLPPMDDAVLAELQTVLQQHPEVLLDLLRSSLLGAAPGGAPAATTGSPTLGESGGQSAGGGAHSTGGGTHSAGGGQAPQRPPAGGPMPTKVAGGGETPQRPSELYRPREGLAEEVGVVEAGHHTEAQLDVPGVKTERPPSATGPEG